MQQHTGQHILSQAFVQTLNAETVSFHMGSDNCTIDLDRASLDDGQVALAIQAANEVVFDNRPVLARFVDKSELETLPLRKMPTVTGPIRVVHIADFDWSPCGGTHVANTGQVGLVQVTRIERRKTQTRIHFLCGWRALVDYTNKQTIVQALSTHLTTAEDEIVPSVQRLEADLKEAHKATVTTQKHLVEYQVREWIDLAEHIAQIHIVKHVFSDCNLDMAKEIARQLTVHPGTVALLATSQEQTHLVFARADDVSADMGDLIRAACAVAGGRGGGRPQFAQGSIRDNQLAEKALSVARHQLLEGQVK